MKYKRWKVSELRFIQENPHMTDKEVGEIYGVSEHAVKKARNRNGIKKGMHSNCRGNPKGNIQNLRPVGGFKKDRIAA